MKKVTNIDKKNFAKRMIDITLQANKKMQAVKAAHGIKLAKEELSRILVKIEKMANEGCSSLVCGVNLNTNMDVLCEMLKEYGFGVSPSNDSRGWVKVTWYNETKE